MKRLLTGLGILLLVLIFSILPASTFMVKKGFQNPDKGWAAPAVLFGGRLRMRLQMYGSAGNILKKMLDTFPEHEKRDRLVYWVALCHEKSGNYRKAAQWYRRFIQAYPQHIWNDQAQRRLTTLEAQHEGV